MSEENQPIECRAAIDISAVTANNEILFLPIGLHAITPVSGGIGRPIKVKVDQETASAVQQQYSALAAKGKRPYFDFNHEDGPASFWPEQFIWRNGEGVIARGEWTGRGKAAVEGKDFRAFSPVFHVDNKRSETGAVVVCKENAEPNMGGLVNNPAFKDLPLWAKNAESIGAPEQPAKTQKEKNQMENEELAALRAKQTELQAEVDALKAQNKDADESETALENVRIKIENAELKSRSALLSDQIQAKNKVEADAAITDAIKCGAILPKDKANQERWRANLTADPATFMPLLKDAIRAAKSNDSKLDQRITGRGNVQITAESGSAIFAAMARANVQGKKSRKMEDKVLASRDFQAIYAAELSIAAMKENPLQYNRIVSMTIQQMDDALAAGDVTDSDLGTLAGTLVVQRTLELLKFEFPSLAAFTTDFTSENATFNQVIMTRTVTPPAVEDYNTSTGWPTGIDAALTSDVPVTINKHKGVPIAFNEQILASTLRRLFDEQAPAQAYSLAKQMVDDLYVNITDANFTHNKVSTLANFNRNQVIDMAVALNLQGVPNMPNSRSLLLYSTYFGAIQKDSAVVTPATPFWPQMITGPQQNGPKLAIDIANFNVYDAPNIPTNNGNVTGFAGSKSALVIATRLPNDYTRFAPGVSYGNVQTVTDPDLGISVMLVQFVDHILATGNQRISLMYGTAAGQGNAGMLLKAATGSGSAQS